MMNGQESQTAGSAAATGGIRDEISQDAERLRESAMGRAEEAADARKSQATKVARSASSALGTAAGELEKDHNAPDWLSSAVRRAAEGIDKLASQIEGRSLDEMGQHVSRFARQNPGSFLAMSAAAGFAAARVLRAGAEHQHHDHTGHGNLGERPAGSSGSRAPASDFPGESGRADQQFGSTTAFRRDDTGGTL